MPHLITRIGLLVLLAFIYTAGASCTVSAPSGPRTIRFGSQHTITCQFSANCFSSSWTKDGLSLSNNPNYTVTSGSTRSSISFNASLSDTGDFVCNVIKFHFSDSSIKRYFRIFVEKAVEVHIYPNAINSVEGEMVSINCTAIGAPTPSSISWYRNGLPLNPAPESNKSTDQQTVTSRLVLQPLERNDEGVYSCSAFNAPSSIGFKTAHSSDVLVTVYYLPLFILQPPFIVEGIAGGNTSLFCSVTANPLPPVVYWLTSNGLNLTNISTSVVVSPKVIESTLTLENVQLSDELNYSCVVEQVIPSNNNRTLIKAQTQLLIAYPPQVSSPIHNVTVNASDEVTLLCEGFGNPRPVIEWYFIGKDGNEVQIHNASRSLPLSDRTIVSNLTLTNVTIDQEGSYRCKGTNNVTNLIGSKEDTLIHLTVHSPPQLIRVNSSSNYSLLVNESITLSFSINFASPPVKSEQVAWTLTTVNREIKELNSSDQFQISADGLSLTIFSVSLEENGFIQSTVYNEVGTDSKGYYLLIGTSPSVSILPRHVGVAIGTRNISFTCSSSGHPIPLLTWYANDQELSLSQDKYSSLYTNTNGTSVLTLFDLGLSDAARYTCLASNVFGNDTVDNHLVVQVPPNITLT
ncbi:PREDICTED: hemicentin-2-like, partial [Amphimedon queenslandica]